MQSPQTTPRSRVILLGASNLTAALPVVVELAREALGTPLDIYAALGRGRSYGMRSSFLVRSMPGIEECGLWAALASDQASRPLARTVALITDLGNDLAFALEPGVIAGWVETALERLERLGARTLLSSLPLANLQRLSAFKFELFRRLIFPGHKLDRMRLIANAEHLDGLLRELARARGATLVELDAAWYGVDPIHIARAQRRVAWSTLLAPWFEHPRAPDGRATRALPGLDWRSELLAPAERRVLGLELRREQPCARLPDGTAIHLY